MILNELFDKYAPFEIVSASDGYDATFNVNGHAYTVTANVRNCGYSVERIFSQQKKEVVENASPKWVDRDYEYYTVFFSDAKGSFEMTGRGDAVVILATVVEFINRLKHQKGIELIYFAAESQDKSRIKVYEHIARRLAVTQITQFQYMGHQVFYIEL